MKSEPLNSLCSLSHSIFSPKYSSAYFLYFILLFILYLGIRATFLWLLTISFASAPCSITNLSFPDHFLHKTLPNSDSNDVDLPNHVTSASNYPACVIGFALFYTCQNTHFMCHHASFFSINQHHIWDQRSPIYQIKKFAAAIHCHAL